MTGAELRAIVAQGPAVVLSSKEDMLALLDENEKLKNAVLLAYEFIRSEYACEVSQALDGHFVSREARHVWYALSEAMVEAAPKEQHIVKPAGWEDGTNVR